MEELHQSDICRYSYINLSMKNCTIHSSSPRNLTASQCDTQILKLCSRLNEYGVHFFKALVRLNNLHVSSIIVLIRFFLRTATVPLRK